MKVALLTLYELGYQSPSVVAVATDLENQSIDFDYFEKQELHTLIDQIDVFDVLLISIPMHTASAMAVELIDRIRAGSNIRIALFGLYAPNLTALLQANKVQGLFAGEAERDIAQWINRPSAQSFKSTNKTNNYDRLKPKLLPPLDRYPTVNHGGIAKIVGAIEASRGCSHRCLHCPVPIVYEGRVKKVPENVIFSYAEQIYEKGARHFSFVDPDFLNTPKRSLEILTKLADTFPDITFDATIKVEHFIKYPEAIDCLVANRVIFVVSAFESLNDSFLRFLKKGHTRKDIEKLVVLANDANLVIRPTWIPFHPESSLSELWELFTFLIETKLITSTDAIQMSIKLLVPKNSLLLNDKELKHRWNLKSLSRDDLNYSWKFSDERLEKLHKMFIECCQYASSDRDRYLQIIESANNFFEKRIDLDTVSQIFDTRRQAASRNEPWFCCAEPEIDFII